MYDHSRSLRFKGGFSIFILNSFLSRAEAEIHKAVCVEKFNTYNDGLNKTLGRKGYTYSDESKRKMKHSAKARAIREGFELRSKRSKLGWSRGGEEYKQHMSNIRKGKRLRKPKLSDEQVEEIKRDFEINRLALETTLEGLIEQYRKYRWRMPTAISLYAKQTAQMWNVSKTTIMNILKGKSRACPLPAIYQS